MVLPILFAGYPLTTLETELYRTRFSFIIALKHWNTCFYLSVAGKLMQLLAVTMTPLYLGQVVLTLQYLECKKELDIGHPWAVIPPGTQRGNRLFEEQ